MKIAFNPSTVAALIAPPNNKDITFDLRGHNIFARGVKFCGTDTNTWRDIKINNVSIDSNLLDLRDGDNTTLTNINGVVTINSTWRPVVDNLTSDSTTSSLSANLGRVLAGLINGKSDSGHTHDDRYVKKTGDTMLGALNFANGTWNKVGDDVYIGDHNIGGLLCIMGANGTTGLSFHKYGDDLIRKSITFDGNTLYMNGSCDYATLSNLTNLLAINTVPNKTTATSIGSWSPISGRYVFHQKWTDTSTGSDSADFGIYLDGNLTANMVLDGYYNSLLGFRVIGATGGFLKANGTIDNSTYLTSHLSLSNYYTKSEVDTKLNSKLNYRLFWERTNIDLNNITEAWHTYEVNNGTDTANTPTNASWHQAVLWGTGDTDYAVLLCTAYTSNYSLYLRHKIAGKWYNWIQLAATTDIPSSLKNPHALTISLNGTSQGPYDGSAAKNINITPSSIGAATSDHNHINYLSANGLISGNIDNIWTHGTYGFGNRSSYTGTLPGNSSYGGFLVLNPNATTTGTYYTTQIALLPGYFGYRIYDDGKWYDWKEVSMVGHNHDGRYVRYYAVTTLDCNNLAVGLTAAGVSATNAAHTNHSAFLYISDVGTPFQIQIPDSSVPYIYKRYYNSGTWSGWFKLNAGYADSAGSATKLQTARLLWGQPFDGTANVSGFMKNVTGLIHGNSIGDDWSDGNNTHPWYGIDYRHCVDSVEIGKAYTSISSYFGLYFKTGGFRFIFDGGDVGIGTASPIEKLDVHGNIISNNVRIYGNEVTNDSKGLFIQASDKTNRGFITYNGNTSDGYLNICSTFSHIVLSPYGNVGIGTTTPAYKLDVIGSLRIYSTYPLLRIENSSGGTAETSIYISNGTAGWAIGVNPWGVGSGVFGIGQYFGSGSSNWRFKIDNSGYCYTQSYLNLGAGNEKNASSPPYVWGVNGSDNYLRTYATNALRVAYASNATNSINSNRLNSNPEFALGNNFLLYFNTAGLGSSGVNNAAPDKDWWHIIRMNHPNSKGYFSELAIALNSYNGVYWRTINAGREAKSWTRLANIGDLAWDNITGKPSSYTPSVHTHSWTSITDKIVAGNEFNIVNAGFNSDMYFNYLPINDRNSTAYINSYIFGNGHQGLALVLASGFVKNGSSSNYVLLGDGGHKAISDFAPSSHSHNYAANENYGGFTKSGRLPISGFYQSEESESGGNAPWSSWMHLINCLHSNTNNNYALQIAASFYDNNTFKIRVTSDNVNNAWRDIIHSGNIGSQSVNYANSAGQLSTTRYIYGNAFNGTQNVTGNLTLSTGDQMNFQDPNNDGVAFNYNNNKSSASSIRIYNGRMSEIARFATNGYFGIGIIPGYRLDVNGEGNFEKGIHVATTGLTVSPNYAGIEIRESGKGGTNTSISPYDLLHAPRIGFHWLNRWWDNLVYWNNELRWMNSTMTGYNPIRTSGYIKNDSSDSYVLLGGGGHKLESALNVGNADTLDGFHATSGNSTPWGTIPVITTSGYMDIGKHLEFHYDNSTGSDYSTALMCLGNYSNIVYLPAESGTLALTSLVLTWKSLVIDMRNYDESYWHPVTVPLPYTGYNKIKVSVLLNIGDKPSWAEHPYGFTCNMEIWAIANGWGTTYEETICLNYTHRYCSLNPCGWTLLGRPSLGVLFLRGGSRYIVYTDFDATFTPHDKTYTWTSSDGYYTLSTGGPYTSCPGLNFNKNIIYANLDGNSSSASKLVTARNIWGQSFDGTADVNGTIYINNSNSSNGAIRLNNNINSNARISAIDDKIIFNTGNAIRFGETAWDWNQWAGLKYTHSNKTIYLGIADGSVFNANSAQSNGTLRLAGITTITPDSEARIGGSGDLYLGNADNSAWVKVQDMCSQNDSDNWSIYQDGRAYFNSIGINTNAYIDGNLEAGLIIREGSSLTWVNGRNGALLRETSVDGYHTLWSLKTTDGSWDFGEYNAGSDWNNVPVLSYITDSNYNSGNNTPTYQIRFPLASGTVALTSNIPNPTNYYWANVKISTSSSTTTSPTVSNLTATNSIRMGNISLEHTDEINNITNGAISLNLRNSGNVSLCQGGGKVGIGTTAPSYKLDVNGSTHIGGTLIINSILNFLEVGAIRVANKTIINIGSDGVDFLKGVSFNDTASFLKSINIRTGLTEYNAKEYSTSNHSVIIGECLNNTTFIFKPASDGLLLFMKLGKKYSNIKIQCTARDCIVVKADNFNILIGRNTTLNIYGDGVSRFFIYEAIPNRWIEFRCG